MIVITLTNITKNLNLLSWFYFTLFIISYLINKFYFIIKKLFAIFCMNKEEELRKRLADILEIEPSKIEQNFMINDSVMDSLSMLAFLAAIDQIYNIPITGDDIKGLDNFGNLLSILEERSK